MRRAKFPLYLKILTLFLVNVALLATALFFILRSQFGLGLGLDSVMSGKSGENITRALRLVTDELSDSKREDWDKLLIRFSHAYGVTFSVFHSEGTQIAGTQQDLPEQVLTTMKKFAPKNRNRDGPPPHHEAPRPLFFERASGYWLGARIQILRPRPEDGSRNFDDPPPRSQRNLRPDIILAHATHLSSTPLLPDPRPLVIGCIGIVMLCALFWVPFVRGVTNSLEKIRDATGEIAAGNFEVQVLEKRNDEIGQLGQSINTMSLRLNGFVNGQQRFLGDIAHELCSPIARMQMAIGVLEQRATDEQKPRVEDVREELQHMADMVNELLSFSKASLKPESANIVIVVLAPFLREVAEREIGLRDADIGLEHSDGLAVMADRQLLARAVGNLLRNAVRYASESAAIALDASQNGNGKINITVRDFGPGVPEEDLPYLLDPFYRPDKARTRERGGTGLGLAIVKTCTEACGGSVSYRNANPGFAVTLTLDAPKFG